MHSIDRQSLTALFAGALLAVAACSEGGTPLEPGDDAVARVEFTSAPDTTEVGKETALVATAYNASGTETSATIDWTVLDQSIARFSGRGVIRGESVGTTRVIAEAGGVADTGRVVVVSPPVASVQVDPDADTVDVGGETILKTTTRDSAGTVVDAELSFTSRSPSVARVDSMGRVVGESTGEAVLVAEAASGARDSATVAVRQLAADMAVSVLDLRPRSVLADSTTTADVVVENRGGHVESVRWELRGNGQVLASGERAAPRRNRADTITASGVGGFATGRYELTAEVSPVGETDARTANDTAQGWFVVREAGFDIELVFADNLPASWRDSARAAADRWEDVITSDLPDIATSEFSRGSCLPDSTGYEGPVDDLVIYVTADDLSDANGKALSCQLRHGYNVDQPTTPFTGRVRVDTASGAAPFRLMLHEIGHVLGLSANGNLTVRPIKRQDDSGQWRYLGPMAVHEFHQRTDAERYSLPLDGPGHWDTAMFTDGEIMGKYGGDGISIMSVAALADHYYAVNLDAADPVGLTAPTP